MPHLLTLRAYGDLCNFFLIVFCQWCSSAVAGGGVGCKGNPQKFDSSKIRAKTQTIRAQTFQHILPILMKLEYECINESD